MKIKAFSKFFSISLLVLSISSCASGKIQKSTKTPDNAEKVLKKMSLEKKIGQMFVVRPEALNSYNNIEDLFKSYEIGLDSLSKKQISNYKKYPAGGIILFQSDIKNPKQLKKLTAQIQSLSSTKIFIYVDEEGGRVARLAKNPEFNLPKYENMAAIGKTNDTTNAYKAGFTIGSYLKDYGIDVNFAPVADVFTNPENTVIGDRAFSSDPQIAAKMDIAFLEGMKQAGIIGCFKHFPGHGDTNTDSHKGYSETKKTWAELKNCEMITFSEGIKHGVPMIMTAHITAPKVTGNSEPSTLSKTILTEKLKGELGYKGVIVTDALDMGAIRKYYTTEETIEKALNAGADLLLMPANYQVAYTWLLNSVKSGKIPEARIDESVYKILLLKGE